MQHKPAITVLILLNLGAVLYSHRPADLCGQIQQSLAEAAPSLARGLQAIGNQLGSYAYVVGLNYRWEMFSFHDRFYREPAIVATYGDDFQTETVKLPVPLQSPRTFWQRNLFDFKEVKFVHNIYGKPLAFEAYGNYLARHYPQHDDRALQSILFESHLRRILPPLEAAVEGWHLDPHVEVQILHELLLPTTPEAEQP